MTNPNNAIVIFKPEAIDRPVPADRLTANGAKTIADIGRQMLLGAGLIVVRESSPQLTPEDVYRIYEKVLKPNPEDDAIWGTDWKQDVVDHLTSRRVLALELRDKFGCDAVAKAQSVKVGLRALYANPTDVVRNLIHVPDPHEIVMTSEIVFGEAESNE